MYFSPSMIGYLQGEQQFYTIHRRPDEERR